MTKLTEERIAQLLNIESVAMEVTALCTADALLKLHESIKPLGPKLYNGYTEKEWQRVIDEGYDVLLWNHHESNLFQMKSKLVAFRTRGPNFSSSMGAYRNGKIVREIGHIQPHFARLGKPDIPDDALVLLEYWEEGKKYSFFEQNSHISEAINWDVTNVKAFIQLTEGTQDVNN